MLYGYCRCMQCSQALGLCSRAVNRRAEHGRTDHQPRPWTRNRGKRITVYDMMDYLQEGWRYNQIAGLFRLPPDDIQAAIAYTEAHKEDVLCLRCTLRP